MSAKACPKRGGLQAGTGQDIVFKQAVNFWSDLKAGAVDTF
jgi:hypothetical protein